MENTKDNQEKKVILSNSANGILLELGDESKKLTPEIVVGMKNHLSAWLKFYEHFIHYAKRYKNFSKQSVKEDLDNQEKEFLDEEGGSLDVYGIGENFATFMSQITDKVTDNNDVEDIIKKDWKEDYPQYADDLEFDAEHSYCYIYTKSREVAEKFTVWAYEKYIKEVLKDFDV